MIKSKASRTTRKRRQHAILSTVVDLNHGKKRKKQMSFGEGRKRWEGKKKCLRDTGWSQELRVVKFLKDFLDEHFFVLALYPSLL
jgi:hypothetical protein